LEKNMPIDWSKPIQRVHPTPGYGPQEARVVSDWTHPDGTRHLMVLCAYLGGLWWDMPIRVDPETGAELTSRYPWGTPSKEHRIENVPEPDVVRYAIFAHKGPSHTPYVWGNLMEIQQDLGGAKTRDHLGFAGQVKLSFDPKTGELKSAEKV
jgi:hypothetical protein